MMGANSCLSILPSDVLMGRCEPGRPAGGRGGTVIAGACSGTYEVWERSPPPPGGAGGGSQRSRSRKLGTAVASSQC